VLAVLFPWPSRAERKAAVAEAQRGAEQAQRQAVHARSLIGELHRMRQRDHVNEALRLMIDRKVREQR